MDAETAEVSAELGADSAIASAINDTVRNRIVGLHGSTHRLRSRLPASVSRRGVILLSCKNLAENPSLTAAWNSASEPLLAASLLEAKKMSITMIGILARSSGPRSEAENA